MQRGDSLEDPLAALVLREDGDRLVDAPEGDVQLGERLDRGRVARLRLERLRVRGGGLVRLGEVELVEIAERDVRGGGPARVGRRRHAGSEDGAEPGGGGLGGEQRGQSMPVAGGGGAALASVEDRQIARGSGEDRVEHGLGLGGLVGAGEARRRVAGRSRAAAPIGLQRRDARPDRRELLELASGGRDLGEIVEEDRLARL